MRHPRWIIEAEVEIGVRLLELEAEPAGREMASRAAPARRGMLAYLESLEIDHLPGSPSGHVRVWPDGTLELSFGRSSHVVEIGARESLDIRLVHRERGKLRSSLGPLSPLRAVEPGRELLDRVFGWLAQAGPSDPSGRGRCR